jgi:hypothetical protein
MQHVPNELVLSILEFWISDPKVTNNELRNTRLVSKLFDAFISPIVFKHLRLVEFNRDAFDNIANLSNSPIARFVKTFEYKTSTRISRRLLPPPLLLILRVSRTNTQLPPK